MAKKTFTSLVPGDPIQAGVLNDNFDNLADVVNTVDPTQFAREGLSWDNISAVVAEVSTTGTAADHPLIGCAHTANASLSVSQDVTISLSATPTVITDGFNNFQLTFNSAVDTPAYTFQVGDAIRYWFGSSAIFYNSTGTEAIAEYAVFYPQFRFTVGGSVGAWLDAYPTPVSADFSGPAAYLSGAITGTGAVYQTVRTAASTGRGPGSYRSIALEGILPVTIANVDKVELRIVAYGVGTTPTDLRVDLTSANLQGVLLRKCYTV